MPGNLRPRSLEPLPLASDNSTFGLPDSRLPAFGIIAQSFTNRFPPVTKVDFYTGSTDKLRTACQLSHKAMQNGLRVLLHTPDEATSPTRWTSCCGITRPRPLFRIAAATRRMHPTCRWCSGIDGATFPHSELLISLHAECLPFFSRFERLIEIVGLEEEDKRQGRERFKFYKDRGYEMRHFDLSKS